MTSGEIAAWAGFGLALIIHTVILVGWVSRKFAELAGEIEVLRREIAHLQHQINNDKEGRKALILVREDIASIKALVQQMQAWMQAMQQEVREIREENRRS